ncbi:MAG: glycerol-3-phosphate dehydrogenase/oxidase [Fibrobacterales bacterium]
MKREIMLQQLHEHGTSPFDIIVIGGGASGLGTAVDAASRGYSALVVEQSDFAKGTSSRSTKLVHGGVRYLAQGDISLVLEALRERGILLKNAPHLVTDQSFIIPNYAWWDGPFYTIGMKVYDTMAGKLGLGPSVHISKEKVLEYIPNLKEDGLQGGVQYYDGQFDDARLAVNLAQTAVDYGALALNYMKVVELSKDDREMVTGVVLEDTLTGERYTIQAHSVVNATGVFADTILQMDDPAAKATIKPSQGVHVVLDRSFLKGSDAIMIPKTSDGRVLFAVPWKNRVVVGTTDTELDTISLEPRALEEEVSFILDTAAEYLVKAPNRSDVLSVFAGLRPLAAPEEDGGATKEISRGHKIFVSLSGLVSVTGGKWTTYRKMAQDAVDKAVLVGGLHEKPCLTESLSIHGYRQQFDTADPLSMYGSDAVGIKELISENPGLGLSLTDSFDFCAAEVIWICRHEMVCRLEDLLARRFRALLLDARASIKLAERVAPIMAEELGNDRTWIDTELEHYRQLVSGYLL